jgi:Right handed beta helix region
MRRVRAGRLGKSIAGLAAAVASLALVPSLAGAATITPNVTTDGAPNADGDCTLREAVLSAQMNEADTTACTNGSPDPTVDEIVLTSGAGYGLTEGQIVINMTGAAGPVLIRSDDPGVRRTISMADDAGDNRVFSIGGSSATTLRALNVVNADEINTSTGGVILNGANLTIENSKIASTWSGVPGHTSLGGGVIHSSGPLTIKDSEITGGWASAEGGGIMTNTASAVRIERSRIHGNRAGSGFAGYGAGLAAFGGSTVVISDSEIVDNQIPGISVGGGGVFIDTDVASATIRRSLITGNLANAGGGGGVRADGPLTLIDSTVFDNTVNTGHGGGVYTLDAATLISSTIAGNSTGSAAGGDQLTDEGAGTTTFQGSIVGGGDNPCSTVTTGALASGGYNAIASEDTACPSAGADAVGGDSGLAGALADNGGTIVGGSGGSPISTLAISNTGTAFNLVTDGPTCAAAEGVDQRGTGFNRPQLGACDAGAFELQALPPGPPGTTPLGPPATTPAGPTGQRSAALKKCKKKKSRKARKSCRRKAQKLPV